MSSQNSAPPTKLTNILKKNKEKLLMSLLLNMVTFVIFGFNVLVYC